MAGERLISVSAQDSEPYIAAIEGLLIHPESYQPDKAFLATPELPRKVFDFTRVGIGETERPQVDPIRKRVADSWTRLVAPGFKDISQIYTRDEKNGPLIAGTRMVNVGDKVSLGVDGGTDRRYVVKLGGAREVDLGLLYSHLFLESSGLPIWATHFFISGGGLPGVIRMEDEEKQPRFYLPSFLEQQRLLAVHKLLSRYV